MKKGSFGSTENRNYVVKVDVLDSNDYWKKSFGQSLSDAKKVRDWLQSEGMKVFSIDAKGKPTMSSVKTWIKDNNPKEYYAVWRKDSDYYKDDSVDIYYKK